MELMMVIFLETSRYERFPIDFSSAIDYDTLLRFDCPFNTARFLNNFLMITILITADILIFLNFAWEKNASEFLLEEESSE